MNKESQRKMRKAAEIIVDMEAGVFEYPDGSPPLLSNGKPRVNQRLALELAGYGKEYARKFGHKVVKHEYFKGQKALIENQKRGNIMKAMLSLQERENTFAKIADRSALLLYERLCDPTWYEKISTSDLFKYALQYHQLHLQLEGKINRGREDKLAIVFADIEQRLPRETRDKVFSVLEQRRQERAREIEEYAAAGNAEDMCIDGEAEEC